MSLNLGHGSTEMGSVPAGARAYGTAGNSGLSSRTEKSLGSAPPQPASRSSADLRKWKAVSRTWTARRSAGSPLGDLLPLSQSPVNRMRRSMSFERVATTSSYLSSEWPRTSCNLHNNRLNLLRCHVILTTDKWTQTSEDIDNQDSGSSKICVHSKLPLSCLENSDWVHSVKERKMTLSALEINNATHFGRSDNIPIIFDDVLQCQAVPATGDCGRNLVTPNQSSAEGFNQEVENLVENTGIVDSDENEMKSIRMQTPDGHRAPVAELLSMGCCQSVRRMLSMSPLISDVENHFVRIPEDVSSGSGDPLLLIIPDPLGSCSASSAAPVSHPHSIGRMVERMCQQPSNVIISPSPVIHKSLRKRQAPEGSELEDGMITNFRANVNNNNFSSPVTTSNLSRCNIPSEHSAFCPLLKKYVGKKSLWMFSVSSVAEAEAQ